MESERFEMRVPKALLDRVDASRGHESRASFFRRAAVEKLNGGRTDPPYPFEAERQAVRAAVAAGVESVRVEAGSIVPASALVESGGCPECGGQWQRRPDAPGRWCVDCGAREAK
jgi:hypothetical protein